MIRRFHRIGLPILLTLYATVALAQSDDVAVDAAEAVDITEVGDKAEVDDTVEQENAAATRADKAHGFVEKKVNAAATWIDSFFDDPNQIAEDASSRIRLRPEVYFQAKRDVKFRLKVAAKIRLPRLSKRASLVIGGDDGTGDFDSSLEDSVEDPSIGVQFFGKQGKSLHTSIIAGVKLNGLALFAGPRFRYLQPVSENSQFRFVQTVRWFTDNGWDSRTRLDYDHVFENGLFLRQTIDGRWRADRHEEEGFRTRVSTAVTQRLKKRSGLQYEWFTIFETEPDSHVASTTLALRYRMRYKKDWLFFEVIPQLAFEDEFDWDPNPGIRFRFEIIFGEDRRQRQASKTHNMQW